MGMQQKEQPKVYQGRLNANATLNQGESLMGENGSNFRFTCQTDGNLVLYQDKTPLWASNTNGKGQGPYRFVVQGDNNLCMYG